MKETRRALRRHHRHRMIRRALRSCVCPGQEELQRAWAVRWYNNLKKCSCHLCGNPRKFSKHRPRQEQRIHEAARAEETEFTLF